MAQLKITSSTFGGEIEWSPKEEWKMASKGSRSRIPAEQKLRILLEVLGGTIDISELYRRVGIHPRQFYRWKKRLMSGATRLFAVEAM